MAQVVTLRAATTEWLPTFMGEIRLECGKANVDLKRLRASQLKLAVDHDVTAPIGHVVRLTPTGEAVTGEAELVEVESTRAALADVNSGLKAGLSFGFVILTARVLKEDERDYRRDVLRVVVTRWQPFELSCTAAPLGIRSRIVGGLLGAPQREAASVSTGTKTAARPKTMTTTTTTKRPRRSLDAGLEGESSPVPPRLPRRAVTSQATYVDGLIRERHTAMTTALDAITRGAPASARQAGGAGAGDTPADSPDASPLARLIQVAASPASPRVHHKTENLELMMDGGRGWARLPLGKVMERAPVQRAAFNTGNTYGTIGTQAGDIRQVVLEDAAVTSILGGVTKVDGLVGDIMPAELLNDDTMSSWVAEGAPAALIDATLRNYGAALTPKVARVSTSYSLQLAIQAGPRFENSIDRHIRRALRKRIAQGVVDGTGIDHQPLGIINTPGVMASEYISADRGKLNTFYDAEDLLDADGQGPVDAGRLWLVSRNLYASARRTPAWGPGGDQRAIDANTIGRGRVGLDTPAVATNLLAADTALYGAFPDCVLFAWENAQVVVDKLSHPGEIRISVLAYISVHARPNSFAILEPA